MEVVCGILVIRGEAYVGMPEVVSASHWVERVYRAKSLTYLGNQNPES